MKIFLIGMPGSGKSTVGQQLAYKLNLPLIDLDAEIEKTEGRLVKEIFATDGEDYFRTVESQVLQNIAGLPQPCVIATGGGAPCFHNGIGIINKAGTSIFLDVSIDELVARVRSDRNRPLLLAGDLNELRMKLTVLRAKRLKFYEQANVIVNGSEVEDVLKQSGL
jgi:shikimate kinase